MRLDFQKSLKKLGRAHSSRTFATGALTTLLKKLIAKIGKTKDVGECPVSHYYFKSFASIVAED